MRKKTDKTDIFLFDDLDLSEQERLALQKILDEDPETNNQLEEWRHLRSYLSDYQDPAPSISFVNKVMSQVTHEIATELEAKESWWKIAYFPEWFLSGGILSAACAIWLFIGSNSSHLLNSEVDEIIVVLASDLLSEESLPEGDFAM